MSLFLANITQDDIGIAMVASVFMLLPVILIFLFWAEIFDFGNPIKVE